MTWQFAQHSDDEGLRLIVAFLQITDPEVRQALIDLAESAARQSSPAVIDHASLRQDNQPS